MKVLQIKTKSISSSIGKEAVKKFLINSLNYTEQKAIKIIKFQFGSFSISAIFSVKGAILNSY